MKKKNETHNLPGRDMRSAGSNIFMVHDSI